MAFFGSLYVGVFAGEFEKMKTNSVDAPEAPTANHLTASKLTRRGIELLSSSALVSGYTAAPPGLYCRD